MVLIIICKLTMPRLLKIVLSTVLGFLGGLLIFLGAHFWIVTPRTVQTLWDPAPAGSDGDSTPIDNGDSWLDTGYLLHKIAAGAVFLLGISALFWFVALV